MESLIFKTLLTYLIITVIIGFILDFIIEFKTKNGFVGYKIAFTGILPMPFVLLYFVWRFV